MVKPSFQYDNSRVNKAKKTYLQALLKNKDPKESLGLLYPAFFIGSHSDKKDIVEFTWLVNQHLTNPIYETLPLPAELDLAYYKNVII